MGAPANGLPDYELMVQGMYCSLLEPGDVVLDVGAHLGRHTIPLARLVSPGGRVLAFEPLPSCREALARELNEHHPELVEWVTLSPHALGAEPGQAEFVFARDDPGYSGLRQRVYDRPTRLSRIPATVRTIDGLCLGLPSLRFIKIDAEGGEFHILQGASACLRKFRPVVAFEFGDASASAYAVTAAATYRFLGEHGYKVYAINGLLLSEEEFTHSAAVQALWDYVAVPAEDAWRGRLIQGVLTGCFVSWLQVKGRLTLAAQQALAVGRMPALSRVPRPLRWPARWAARGILLAARMFLNPRKRLDTTLLDALRLVAEGGRQLEQRLQELERRLEAIEGGQQPGRGPSVAA